MKKILLAAVNAKYIHSNLAVYSLKSYAQSRLRQEGVEEIPDIEVAEYTINQQIDEILRDIYKRQPDFLGLSCYIWNLSTAAQLLEEIPKILPSAQIWLGGPEVSYDARSVLENYPRVKGVMKGEGEETFTRIVAGDRLRDILGITYRDNEGKIIENPWRPVMDLSSIPFVYRDMEQFRNKIIYYESSRGCPFSCSYCLSSVDKTLRLRKISLVKQELQFFIDQKVEQVKFVDRTFNCSHRHAKEIWKYIKEHDNGVTNFHFEVSADLLDEEEIRLIQSMRPGLIQLEIGVQSTNSDTIREIRRTMRFDRLRDIVRQIQKNHNVHQHLDLIAGLPFEDLESFSRSFNEVYALHPDQLQLGFLKVLKGSYMEEKADDYGLLYKSTPPYEVLSTKWLTYREVLTLKGVEEMTEVYYNSGQFKHTLSYMEEKVDSPFALYRSLSEYYERNGLFLIKHSRVTRYEILLRFVEETMQEETERVRELLIYDFYLRENAKSRPEFAGAYSVDSRVLREFYRKEEESPFYLTGYEKYDRNQMRRMTHLEYFPISGKYVLFDYQKKHPLTRDAAAVFIAKTEESVYNGCSNRKKEEM